MEKCNNCKWNEEGMVCPQLTFCGKSMKEHDEEVRKEFIERICSKFKQDATITNVLRNAMNDVLTEYGV